MLRGQEREGTASRRCGSADCDQSLERRAPDDEVADEVDDEVDEEVDDKLSAAVDAALEKISLTVVVSSGVGGCSAGAAGVSIGFWETVGFVEIGPFLATSLPAISAPVALAAFEVSACVGFKGAKAALAISAGGALVIGGEAAGCDGASAAGS
ncbi:hypothetical protein GQX74_009049 [Glossina fuscipes]|nr:hypothetical protein GQX74_009049 [Glossina fuscipes]